MFVKSFKFIKLVVIGPLKTFIDLYVLKLCFFRLPDDFEKPEFATVNIQRDLFYGYDTLMENVSDPSHIDFAHHKVQMTPFNLTFKGWIFYFQSVCQLIIFYLDYVVSGIVILNILSDAELLMQSINCY